MLKFPCTVEVLNLLATSLGHNGKIKPVKGVVSLKKLPNRLSLICVSTNKSLEAHQYLIETITSIRKTFIQEGKLTIIFRDPAVNLMIRDAEVIKLTTFIREIKTCLEQTNGPVESEFSQEKDTAAQKSQQRIPDTRGLISSSSGETKPAPQCSKLQQKRVPATLHRLLEASGIKKALKTNVKNNILKVKRKSDYPVNGFDQGLKEINMNDVLLRKVDLRLLRLKNLRVLNLADNKINSIELLTLLQSRLHTLNLDTNKIGFISEDVFSAESLSSLEHLSLNNNELENLPRSIVKLAKLKSLAVSKNKLTALPYNMHLMNNLTNLILDGNKLSFVPFPLTSARLAKLDISDNSMCNFREAVQVSVKLEKFPTLFEIAASFVATHNYKNRKCPGKLLQVTPIELPPIVCDMVEACKYCKGCGNMASRYTLRNQRTRIFADSIISDLGQKYRPSHLPTKVAICENCLVVAVK